MNEIIQSITESNKRVLHERSRDVVADNDIQAEFNKHGKVLGLEKGVLYNAFKTYDKLLNLGCTTNTEPDSWLNTAAELTAITYEMDVIHERYSGKENRTEREELLTPLRVKCVAIGKRRQALVKTITNINEKERND